MSEMIERVAKALFAKEYRRKGGWTFADETRDATLKAYWLDSARAAIEAMREPTEAMEEIWDWNGDVPELDIRSKSCYGWLRQAGILGVIVCALLSASHPAVSAEVVDVANARFVGSPANIVIDEDGTAVDFADANARRLNLSWGGVHFVSEGRQAVIRGQRNDSRRQSARLVGESGNIHGGFDLWKAVRRVGAATAIKTDIGGRPPKILEREIDLESRGYWGAPPTFETSAENIRTVGGEGLFHLVELPLHGGQLHAENNRANYPGNQDSAGEDRHQNLGSSHKYPPLLIIASLLGGFYGFFGAIFCLVIGLRAGRVSLLCVAASVPCAFVGAGLSWLGAYMLTTPDRRSENVVVQPVVVTELKLRDVQRQILGADLVKRADDPALEDAPEAFNRVRVDRTDNVLAALVIDGAMRIFGLQLAIGGGVIGAEKADLVRHGSANELHQRLGTNVAHDARNHVALAADRTGDRDFARGAATGNALVPMLVLFLAADERLIDFNDAAQLGFRLDQCGTDFVGHKPCGFDGAEAHVAAHLASADALLAGHHEMHKLVPIPQRLVRVLEDCADRDGKAIARGAAFGALPVPRTGRQIVHRSIAATRAGNALRPPASLQIGLASILVPNRKHVVELGAGELVDCLGTVSHVNPSDGRIFPQ